ncbi:MAG: Gx transporter family protein [Acidaminococcaceae bacterium]
MSFLLAMAVVLRLVENTLPFPIQVPGAKPGLANSVTIIALSLFGSTKTALFLAARILLVAILSTGLFTPGFFIGLGGALLSFLLMAPACRSRLLSPLGIGILGACAHNCGQLIIAMLLMETTALISYLPLLLLLAIPTGLTTGLLAKCTLPIIRQRF